MERRRRNQRNRLDPMKNAGYIGKLVETRSFERQRVAVGLISVDQLRDKFMCRPRYIRHMHRAAQTRAGCIPKKKQKKKNTPIIQDSTVSRPIAISLYTGCLRIRSINFT